MSARAKPGERKLQILQTIAEMLQQPQADKITTASLAAAINISEAALYRQFSSKAQMFEGLIAFIEQSLFGLINKISTEESAGLAQLEKIIAMLLGFAQKNPGLTRVLVGDALTNEDERLKVRMNQLHERLEASLRQCLRIAQTQQETAPGIDINAQANFILCFVIGRWQQYTKSGFRRNPLEYWAAQWKLILTSCVG